MATVESETLDQYLKLRDVTALLGVGRSSIYRWMDEGRFPRPVTIGPNTRRWLRSDIRAWQAEIHGEAPHH